MLNIRNHQKIVYIDNKILWIGGNNIGIEYLGIDSNFGIWNDIHCKINNVYFNYFLKKYLLFKNNFTIKKMEFLKKNFFFENYINLFNVFKLILKKKIIIISPYIILDLKLIFLFKKLKYIHIYIYVTYKSDNLYIQNSSFIFLKFLKKYKIKIYFLKKGFFHRKIYIIDNFFFLGSNNFDNRSIYINKECLFCFFDKNIKKTFFKKIKNFIFYINYKKKIFFIKFIYIISFLNYFFQ
ncbi:hypothetical protein CUN91_00970 [Candidatus Carsonella ruddii]|uniref:PLD phosphodiesterase domain-containing protein n=1 Tax=Carsonella ruddii TaxID=114186 RepID=A0A2K8K4I5_CARRU|nr:phospholipase D-like domain-containing protein [Candidatus Carsonella ruddii]ATX33515.1 hypothetical protein CUN91_00970 [Candidatus Carsonella ruddii]